MTICIHSAFRMVMMTASAGMDPVMEEIHGNSDDDGQHKKNGKNDQSLIRNHRQHDESLVSGRRDHHGDEGTETEHTVCIE